MSRQANGRPTLIARLRCLIGGHKWKRDGRSFIPLCERCEYREHFDG